MKVGSLKLVTLANTVYCERVALENVHYADDHSQYATNLAKLILRTIGF